MAAARSWRLLVHGGRSSIAAARLWQPLVHSGRSFMTATQTWDLGRITAPTIIDTQIIEQLFQFLPHCAIVPSIVSGNT